jgi:hypothetical protein
MWGSGSGLAGSQKEKDPSTMDSCQKNKERSQERRDPKSPKAKRAKKDEKHQISPERPTKVEKEKPVPEDNCLKCSKGFFF